MTKYYLNAKLSQRTTYDESSYEAIASTNSKKRGRLRQ